MDPRRHQGYCVAVTGERHAWVFRMADGRIERLVMPAGEGMCRPGLAGWCGLDAVWAREHVVQLTPHHHRESASALAQLMRAGAPEPLVLGGQLAGIGRFRAMLAEDLRDRYAGSFIADPRWLTPSAARDLAEPAVARWAGDLLGGAAACLRFPMSAITKEESVAEFVLAGDHAERMRR